MEKNQLKINFDPEKHLYTDTEGRRYTSVTTLIGMYKVPFNKRYWSMYTALKEAGFKVIPTKEGKVISVNGVLRSIDSLYRNPINNHDVQKLVQRWDNITKEACDRGNTIHNFLEDSINESKNDKEGKTNDIIRPLSQVGNNILVIRNQHDLDKTGLQDTYPDIYIRLASYIMRGCTLFAEKKVFLPEFLIAGMVDVLIVHLPSKQFAIMDWKTNKDEMLFNSGYYKKENYKGVWVKSSTFIKTDKHLLSPLDSVEDCKGMIYSLQLSLYAVILSYWGYRLVENGLEIFHIRPNERPKLIKVPFLQKEILKMLEHHKNTRILKKQTTTNLFGIK